MKAHLLGIESYIVGGHAVGNRHEQQAYASGDTTLEDEAVEREWTARDAWLGRSPDQSSSDKTYKAGRKGYSENDVIGYGTMKHQAKHRTNRHGKVVGQAEIAQSLATTLGWQYVDDNSASTHRSSAKGQAMEHTEEGEEHEGTSKLIPGKNYGEYGIGHEIERFASKPVNEIARERTYTKGRHCVTRQYEPDECSLGFECLSQIEREYGHQHPKAQKHQKVGGQHQAIAGSEKPLHGRKTIRS